MLSIYEHHYRNYVFRNITLFKEIWLILYQSRINESSFVKIDCLSNLIKNQWFFPSIAPSAAAVVYTDYFSAEG